ncbi:MAG: hypothetical protein WCH76_05945 [Candidatus Riflemargulisbacteria bacterium]
MHYKIISLPVNQNNIGEVALGVYVGTFCDFLLSKYSDTPSFVWSNFVDVVI